MRYAILGGLGAVAGLLAGVCYAIFFMAPPPPVVIDGHTYMPCGLAVFPIMAEGGLVGLTAGCSGGLLAAKFLLARRADISSTSAH
jgi:hypothetical protein